MDDRELEDKQVETDNELKQLFVQYVGNKLKPKDDLVTVEMCVEVLAQEFPDFLLLVAQENFIRGYKQCIMDMEHSQSDTR